MTNTSPRGDIRIGRPTRDGNGWSRMWQRTIAGMLYSFNAVVMPITGDLRYYASRCDAPADRPRMGSDWHRVGEWTIRAQPLAWRRTAPGHYVAAPADERGFTIRRDANAGVDNRWSLRHGGKTISAHRLLKSAQSAAARIAAVERADALIARLDAESAQADDDQALGAPARTLDAQVSTWLDKHADTMRTVSADGTGRSAYPDMVDADHAEAIVDDARVRAAAQGFDLHIVQRSDLRIVPDDMPYELRAGGLLRMNFRTAEQCRQWLIESAAEDRRRQLDAWLTRHDLSMREMTEAEATRVAAAYHAAMAADHAEGLRINEWQLGPGIDPVEHCARTGLLVDLLDQGYTVSHYAPATPIGGAVMWAARLGDGEPQLVDDALVKYARRTGAVQIETVSELRLALVLPQVRINDVVTVTPRQDGRQFDVIADYDGLDGLVRVAPRNPRHLEDGPRWVSRTFVRHVKATDVEPVDGDDDPEPGPIDKAAVLAKRIDSLHNSGADDRPEPVVRRDLDDAEGQASLRAVGAADDQLAGPADMPAEPMMTHPEHMREVAEALRQIAARPTRRQRGIPAPVLVASRRELVELADKLAPPYAECAAAALARRAIATVYAVATALIQPGDDPVRPEVLRGVAGMMLESLAAGEVSADQFVAHIAGRAGAAIVADESVTPGEVDELVEVLKSDGWTLAPETEFVGGRRVRYMVPPQAAAARLFGNGPAEGVREPGRVEPALRSPYVGEGADGARRSAEIDRSEADTYPTGSDAWQRCRSSAERWDEQAEYLEAVESAPAEPTLAERGGDGEQVDVVDGQGYLACGCHGSQREHTCDQPAEYVDEH